MKDPGGTVVMPKSASRTRFVIATFVASLLVGIVTFIAAANIVLVSTYQTTVFPQVVSDSHGNWSWVSFEREIELRTVGLGWDSNHEQLSTLKKALYSNDIRSATSARIIISSDLSSPPHTILIPSTERLDMVTRGLAAGLLALWIGLCALLARRVHGVLRACYANAPKPRPARYLALVSVLLPARERQQWWLELCSTLAESAHRDRRRHSWSYLRAAPALILISWRVHRSRPTQPAKR
ncbi:MAG: hypothetical protein ACRDTC_16575 [Pseudonocardiaceae bacterium]